MSLKRIELAALILVIAAAAFTSGYMIGKDNVNIEISMSERGTEPSPIDSFDTVGEVQSSAPETRAMPESAGLLDINSATAEDLELLPGIGPVLAARVVEYREAYGGFKDKSDIKNVEGIGESIYGDIEPFITVTEG